MTVQESAGQCRRAQTVQDRAGEQSQYRRALSRTVQESTLSAGECRRAKTVQDSAKQDSAGEYSQCRKVQKSACNAGQCRRANAVQCMVRRKTVSFLNTLNGLKQQYRVPPQKLIGLNCFAFERDLSTSLALTGQ
jgi:hypothetical protein